MADPDWKTILGFLTALLTLVGSFYGYVNASHPVNTVTNSQLSAPVPTEESKSISAEASEPISTEASESISTKSSESRSEKTSKSSSKESSMPSADIRKVWYTSTANGIETHVKYDTENLADEEITVKEFFHWADADDTPLIDTDGLYATNGKVTSLEYDTPEYDSDTCDDLEIFIPYDELHLPRGGYTNSLKFHVLIFYDGDKLDTSAWHYLKVYS